MSWIRTTAVAVSFTLASLTLSSRVTSAAEWDFEDAKLGSLPAGWEAPNTGGTLCSGWEVERDETAPRGSKVLLQTSCDCDSPLLNVCLAGHPKLADVDLSVSLKAIGGDIEQGGGVVWRVQDSDNYYVARVNPLETNFRLFAVVAGKQTMLATADVKATVGEWHSIRVTQRDDKIEAYFNGRKLLSAVDKTFEKPGQIGVWAKSDAITAFDRLSAMTPPVNRVAAESDYRTILMSLVSRADSEH